MSSRKKLTKRYIISVVATEQKHEMIKNGLEAVVKASVSILPGVQEITIKEIDL